MMKAMLLTIFSYALITSSLCAQFTGGAGDGYAMGEQTVTIVGIGTTGIDKIEISVFPNPTTTGQNLRVSGNFAASPMVIRWLDISGREKQSELIDRTVNGEVTVSTIGLAAGVYVLKLEQEGHQWQKQVILLSGP